MNKDLCDNCDNTDDISDVALAAMSYRQAYSQYEWAVVSGREYIADAMQNLVLRRAKLFELTDAMIEKANEHVTSR